MNLLFNVRS